MISKLVLVTMANLIVLTSDPVTEVSILLQQALTKIPNPSSDGMVREVGKKVAQRIYNEDASFQVVLPTRDHMSAVHLLAWAAASGRAGALEENIVKIGQLICLASPGDIEVYSMCREALEVLTVMFMLVPDAFSRFSSNEMAVFHGFIIDLVLNCPDRYVYTSFYFKL